MFFAIIVSFWGTVIGQIYCSEECYYSMAGSSSVSYVVRFRYSKNTVWLKNVSHSTVRKNLAKNKDFYYEETWTDGEDGVHRYDYVPSISTSNREVYKRTEKWPIRNTACPNCANPYIGVWGCQNHGYKDYKYHYVAFSKDKTSFIEWWVSADDIDGNIWEKKYYTLLPKDELIPKEIKYDFLDD